MDLEPMDLVAKWRQAEREDDLDGADRAFAQVAREWPREAVPARLVARIVARAVPVPATGRVWGLWWVRAAVAVPVLAAGTMLSWQEVGGLAALVLSAFQTVAAGVGSVIWAAGTWLATVAAVGRPLVRAALVVGDLIASPVPAMMLFLNILLSAGALAVLHRVLAVREV